MKKVLHYLSIADPTAVKNLASELSGGMVTAQHFWKKKSF